MELCVGQNKQRALFICKQRLSYGNSYGLLNSASFIVDYLNSIGITSELTSVIDANEVDKKITEYDPLFVFIEALWITPEKLKEIMSLKRHKKRVFIIRIHSRVTFIANEGIAFSWLTGYRELGFKNLLVAPNNLEFAEDLHEIYNMQSIYLPNIYSPPLPDDNDKTLPKEPKVMKIGCFGSLRPMKNHLAQAIGAVKFAEDINRGLEFHVNATRMEQQGDQVLKNLRAFFNGLEQKYILVEHDWLDYQSFIKLVQRMDIGMQVSLSETFNIIAADFVNNNIPMITSDQISWMPSRFKVDDPNSTAEICEALKYAWSYRGYILRRSSKRALIAYNQVAKNIWNKFIL